jgi:type I restriction enzyme S subunit
LRFPEFAGEWESKELSKIGKTYNGLSGKSGSDFGQGSPYITYKSIFADSKVDLSRVEYVSIAEGETQNRVAYGDIFFTTSSETPEEVGMSSVLLDAVEDCYLNSFCFGYRLYDLKEHIPEFFRFYLRSDIARKNISVLAQGSTRFNISKSEVMKLNMNFPLPKEQTKIATFLSLLDDRIATQSQIIKELESLINGIANLLLGGSLYDFETSPLSALCSIRKGEQINGLHLSDTGDYYVMNGGIVPSGYHSAYNSEANTISISEGGNSCGYVQYNASRFWSGGHCYTLNDVNDKVLVGYLYHYLKNKEKKIMELRVGSGLPNIQKKELERFEVRYPSQEKQQEIVRILDALTDKIETERNLHSEYQKQKKYLLNQMFI